MPISLGMKDRVASLIWVAAWKILTIRPMINATSNSGAATIKVTSIALRPMVMTVSGVIESSNKSAPLLLFGARRKSLAKPDDFQIIKATKKREMLVKTLGQGPQHQLPAIHQHEQHQLEWQRNDGRRQHHHAHRHQHRGPHHVD